MPLQPSVPFAGTALKRLVFVVQLILPQAHEGTRPAERPDRSPRANGEPSVRTSTTRS
jgi:hypothetical protein